MNQFYKNLALWLVIGIVLIALFNMFNQPLTQQSEVVFSDFMDQVEQGQVNEVIISGDSISGKYIDGKVFQSTAPPKDPDLIKSLRQKNVRIVVVAPEQTSWYMNILISWFPMLLLLGIWIFFMRQMQACICLIKKIHMPNSNNMGNHEIKMFIYQLVCSGATTTMRTFF